MDQQIVLNRDAQVAKLIIDRGAEGNLLTLDMIEALTTVIKSCDDAKLVFLSSTGADFCLGRDPKGNPTSTTALDIQENLVRPILRLYDAIANVPAPVICAVQGRATGLGCALATSCDITIAAADALFRLPEMERNLPPTLAISAMMRRVPQKTLTWLIYSMREINAEQARQYGLLSDVVPAAELKSAAQSLLHELSARSRDSLAAVKEYMKSAPAMGPQAAADYAASLLGSVMSSGRS